MKIELKKIKAFTLSEMMVVLVITLIVVALAFAMLNLVQKQMGGIEKNYENGTTIQQLRQALWIDFTKYAELRYDPENSKLYCSNEMHEGVVYTFEDTFVLRASDTLAIPIGAKVFYFDGLEVAGGTIDAMQLRIGMEANEKTIFVYKNNPAVTYMK